jgi:hypothetical protein
MAPVVCPIGVTVAAGKVEGMAGQLAGPPSKAWSRSPGLALGAAAPVSDPVPCGSRDRSSALVGEVHRLAAMASWYAGRDTHVVGVILLLIVPELRDDLLQIHVVSEEFDAVVEETV